MTTYGRFEIRNFESQKWVSILLAYLVKNFLAVILRRGIFLVFIKNKCLKGAKSDLLVS
jgi:hypothetical protein